MKLVENIIFGMPEQPLSHPSPHDQPPAEPPHDGSVPVELTPERKECTFEEGLESAIKKSSNYWCRKNMWLSLLLVLPEK